MLQLRVLVRFAPLQLDQLDQHDQLPSWFTVGAAPAHTAFSKDELKRCARHSRCLGRLAAAAAMHPLPLTWVLSIVDLVILAGQAFVQVWAQAHAPPAQQSQSGPVVTRLTLAHVVLCHVVRSGPLQV